MNSLQKQAWLTVILTLVCVVVYAGLCPLIGAEPALGAFGLFGIVGLGPLVFRKEAWDERDGAINRRAALVGGMVSYLVFVVACMGTWTVVYYGQGSQQISVHVLSLITGAGGFAFFNTHALAILLLYRSRLEADHG